MATLQNLVSLTGNGAAGTGDFPYGSLTADAQGNLYGTALQGGANDQGTIFEIARDPTSTTGYSAVPTVLASFSSANNGAYNPVGGPTIDAQGNLYGTTFMGGATGNGTIYELARTGTGTTGYATAPTTLVSFTGSGVGSTGSQPYAGLLADAQGNLYGTTFRGGATNNGSVYELVRTGTSGTGAPTYAAAPTTLASFTGSGVAGNGSNPAFGSLTFDTQGNLYGTTLQGGANNTGTVFEIARTGTVGGQPTYAAAPTVLTSFAASSNGGNATGDTPFGSVSFDAQGNLFGTTYLGGANNTGTVFEIARTGTVAGQPTYAAVPTVLTSFAANAGNTTGANPNAAPIVDAQGNLFGTATVGGANGFGTVYELAHTGTGATGYSATPTVLASFTGSGTTGNGQNPAASLTADASGNLYGTALQGGANGNGTVFRVTNSGFAVPAAPTPAPAPCYVTGTRIRVLRGLTIQDVPVERLAVGDLAITASGKPRPIRWIGARAYPGLTAPKHDRPVRIRAGALGDGVPARDLLVSPDHCLWLDSLFVAAGHLSNGTSIVRGEAVRDLTYWHVELDSHDLLMAENIPAESFLAAPGVRAGFDGTAVPDAAVAPVAYAPRAERHAPEMDALRERLILRAGLSIAPTRFGAVRAWLDVCDGARVAGWAQDAAHPDAPVCLDILVDGEIVAMALAQDHRADLATAGMDDGRHGFDIELDAPLAPSIAHTVEVRRSVDGLRVCAMAVDAAGAWTAHLAA